MQGIEASYLSAVAVGLGVAYVCLYFLYQYLFNKKVQGLTTKSFKSIIAIVCLSGIIYVISFYAIPDKVLGNRFLHAFGGGFMVFFTCISVVRDTKVRISRTVLFISGFMIVTILGLMNEAIEIFLQNHIHFLFAPSALDTMLDIVSNTVGFLIASICLLPTVPSVYPSSRKRSEVLR